MTRVVSILALMVVALAAPLAAEAQQAEKVRRIGYLNPLSLSEPGTVPLVKAFEEGLRAHGWVVGQTLAIDGVRVTFCTTPSRLHQWLRQIDRWIAYANLVVEE